MTLCVCLLLSAFAAALNAVEGANPEARKREYASIQKELEAARPEANPTQDEVMMYLELTMEKYGKFAKDNPKTPEGFEAASTVSAVLSEIHHPKAFEFAELAATVAPLAGVDMERVAMCWGISAEGRLRKGDVDGARAAIEKIKPLNKGMYEQITAQFEAAATQILAQRDAAENLKPGKTPYPIEEKDLSEKQVSLKNLRGKVVVIDFWATWCGPCMNELPMMLKLYEDQNKKGLEIVGISLDKNKGQLTNAITKHEIKWPVIMDRADNTGIAHKWAVQSIPSTFVLDRKGVIRHVGLRGEDLLEAVTKLIAEKPE